jgi:hypothetical protein
MSISLENLINSLQQGVVEICFTKVDGSDRTMLSTTRPDYINYEFMQKTKIPNNTASSAVIKVWDTEKGAWRSIRIANIKTWKEC